jgi:AcrR family transcriptional regulator
MAEVSYKQREKRRREEEILLEARRLIHKSGVNGLSMDDLANAVGISKPTLYQHFKSKDELIVHVIVTGMQELENYLCTTTEPSPLERLKTVLRQILVHRYSVHGLLADFETDLIHAALTSHPDVLAAKGRIMAEVSRVIEEGKARGEIQIDVPTSLQSCLLFKMIGLPAAVEAMLPDSRLRDPQALSAHIEHIVELYSRAVAIHP